MPEDTPGAAHSREDNVPKFLVKASYTADGARGLLKEGGTARREAVRKLVEGLGGKVEAFYYAYGDVDAYIITDLPDPGLVWPSRSPSMRPARSG